MSIAPTNQELKSRQTKASLSETALHLFRQFGVEKVTIDDICTQCGVTKGAFYHYFPSKDHIITYAVNHDMDRYIAAHLRPDAKTAPQERLMELQKLSFAYFQNLGKPLTRYSYEGQVRSMIELREPERFYVRTLTEIIDQCIAEKLFRGELNRDSYYMMAIILYTGLLLKWSSTPEEKDRLFQWDQILEELISGMFARQ